MCLIIFAYNVHPAYRLILAANRDEFYERPSAPADFWKDAPEVLAGRDLKENGTWLGITRKGKLAAITNYRDPAAFNSQARSRGKLVKDFLCGKKAALSYIDKISAQSGKYNGYNLILSGGDGFYYFSNREEKKQELEAGIYGLSNHLLDTPWPKVVRGKKMMKAVLNKKGAELEEDLFALLSDRRLPPADKLPATGVGRDWERVLSPIFIQSPHYGTRSSTVLLIGKKRCVTFMEKVYDGRPQSWLTSRFTFNLEK